jgi:hypothetical protein
MTREEVRQITENVTGFFDILAEWSQAERSEAGNDSAESYQAATGGGVRHAR